MNRIYYLVYYGYEKTVVESQVITPARLLQREGFEPVLLFFEDFTRWLNRRRCMDNKHRLAAMGITSYFLPRIPRNFLSLNSVLLYFLLLPRILNRRPLVVHARGFQGAASVCRLKHIAPSLRVICDSRGLEAEEYEYSLRQKKGRSMNPIERRWYDRLHQIEKEAISRSDVVFAVSRTMLGLLQERDPAPHKNWDYVPCAVTTGVFSKPVSSRNEQRIERGIVDRLVILYAGSAKSWQLSELLPKIFKRFRHIEPRSYFLALTPDTEELRRLFTEAEVPEKDFSVVSVPYEKIPEAMSCGDIGLLLREDHPVNTNACPTKFAEYLAAGLHVITTRAIRDIADFIEKEQVGTVISNLNDENNLSSDLEKAVSAAQNTSERISRSIQAVQRGFDWDRYVPVIKKWYLQLLNARQNH